MNKVIPFEERVEKYCKDKVFKLLSISKNKNLRKRKIKVKCKRGHAFKKTYRAVIENVGCFKCHNINKIKDTSDIKKIVRKKGWKCLSKVFKGSKGKKYKFKCNRGHIFYKTYNNAKNQKCKKPDKL